VPTRWFPNGAVASPHHLASAAGQAVLSAGGNAVDAVVAANLALAVVTPYHCGAGGDLLAIVWDGAATGVVSVGRAPTAATPQAIRDAIAAGHGDSGVSLAGTGGMPTFGALAVTVPGAIAGWFHLLERWGTRSFAEVAAAALGYARDGFPVSAQGAAHVERARASIGGQPGWEASFGAMRAGETFMQPDLASALALLCEDGPQAFYGGAIGAAVVDVLQEAGSTMSAADLRAHRVEEVIPLQGRFRDLDVLELPPPTQGVTALTALGLLDRLPPRSARTVVAATHHEIEAVRIALTDRQQYLGDPATMTVGPADLLAPRRLRRLSSGIGDHAAELELARPAPGGTAYLCAGDADGLLVSLIQSNFVGFGSGVVVPGWGIGLHNRGAHFRLTDDPDDPDRIGPGRQPMHTLIPALALRDGLPHLVFGTMGGDGQAQIHAQLLRRWVDSGEDLQAAIDAPRFVVDVGTDAVLVEGSDDVELLEGLAARGHDVYTIGRLDHRAGHAHALRVCASGYAGATDPRCEGAVIGH
jgi:gamma-glutamyltranspeptidase / glutathione hydrolase